jgi:hypothetical protein
MRLFVFPMYDLKSKFKKVDDYLDDSIFYSNDYLLRKIDTGEFDLVNEKLKFQKTFDLLFEAKGTDVFKRSTGTSGQQFLESYYEAIAIGLYFNIDKYSEDDMKLIITKIDDLENQEEFKKARGIGTNTEIRIKKLVPFSKKYFSKEYSLKKGIIDEKLVRVRNEIAHGEIKPINPNDSLDTYDLVFPIMEEFKNDIQNSVSTMKYNINYFQNCI